MANIPGWITGRVFDVDTDIPLENIKVKAKHPTYGTYKVPTNDAGYFLMYVPAGNYKWVRFYRDKILECEKKPVNVVANGVADLGDIRIPCEGFK